MDKNDCMWSDDMIKRDFGQTNKGELVSIYRLKNQKGIVAYVSDLGASLQALFVPDKNGNLRDVVLGYESADAYETSNCKFLGMTVGRNANRISNSVFQINGITYRLESNRGKHNLHSGPDFYGGRLWSVVRQSESSITFGLHSEDGDQGFPGEVDIEVTYLITETNDVEITYYGIPTKDTIINMTNHSFFNLNGHDSGSVSGHCVWINSDSYTRYDEESIPTGEFVLVKNTPMDFRVRKEIGLHRYDYNFVLNNCGQYDKVAELYSPASGILMEVSTDLPGLQFYTGDFLSRVRGKNGAIYSEKQGVCFETQQFPNAVNQGRFKSPICRAGEVYFTKTAYRFTY